MYKHPSPGGISSYLSVLANGLQELGIETEIISFSSLNKFVQRLLILIYALHRLSIRIFYPIYLFFLKNILKLHLLTRYNASKWQLCHAQDPLSLNCAGVINRLFNTKLVLTVHGILTAETKTKFKKISPFLERILLDVEKNAYTRAQIIICVEKSRKRNVIRHIKSEKKIILQNNFVDGSKFQKRPGNLFDRLFSAFRYKILNPKRLVESSGIFDFLDAIEQILKIRDDCAFIFLGRGYLRRKLSQEICLRNLEKNVFMFPAIAHEFMPRVYNSIDVVVLSSKPIGFEREGMSISILEAMASEVPVIATSVGGSRTIISDGYDGFLIPPNNPSILARRILDLLEDPSTGMKIGKNARKKILQEYEKQGATRIIKRLYSRALRS